MERWEERRRCGRRGGDVEGEEGEVGGEEGEVGGGEVGGEVGGKEERWKGRRER